MGKRGCEKKRVMFHPSQKRIKGERNIYGKKKKDNRIDEEKSFVNSLKRGK